MIQINDQPGPDPIIQAKCASKQRVRDLAQHRFSPGNPFPMPTTYDRISTRRALKHLSASLLAALLVLSPVMAQNVPFATPPSSRNPSESAVGTLANIMLNMQLRHIKLWFAGKAKNWDLVKYEAEKLKADFDVAAAFYRGLPVENVLVAAKPLNDLIEAAAKKDAALYTRTFNDLTDGCNSCHAAAQIGFVRIRAPKALPFDNQSYQR